MKNPSHTDNHNNERLNHFLTKIVDEKDLAKILRRASYLITLSFIRSEEKNNPMSPEWADESYYFLNELAECLDPVLYDKED